MVLFICEGVYCMTVFKQGEKNVHLAQNIKDLRQKEPKIKLHTLEADHVNTDKFEWDIKKHELIQLLADGLPKTIAAQTVGVTVDYVRGCFRHKEFVDMLNKTIMETGLSLKEDRLARLKRMADHMENIFYAKAEQVIMNPRDEQITFISKEFRELLKQISIEKQEYVEVQRQEVSGSIEVTANIRAVDNYVKSLPDIEREQLLLEFKNVADEVVTTAFINEEEDLKNE